jgi:biotin transport system substrate-specific component
MKGLATSLARPQTAVITKNVALVVSASLFVALCAQVSVQLPFTPIPLSLVNFAVLAVGLVLGSKRGFAALALYLAEGAVGLPVFAHAGGFTHLFGPAGGYVLAYPFVAFLAGLVYERTSRSFSRGLLAGALANVLLFVSGVSWMITVFHLSFAQAITLGLYPFLFGEIIKIMGAAAIAVRFRRFHQN